MDRLFMKMHIGLQRCLQGLQESMADRERGATAVEYGLMVALITGVIVLAVTALGVKVNGLFTTATTAIP
jgi:pilus assembly protein Flp/PilA